MWGQIPQWRICCDKRLPSGSDEKKKSCSECSIEEKECSECIDHNLWSEEKWVLLGFLQCDYNRWSV